MHKETISICIACYANDALGKKNTLFVKIAGSSHSILLPVAAVFDVNDTGNARPSQIRVQFSLSFFSSSSLFLDSRQTGKAAIKNAARGNVERGIGYFARLRECIFHIMAFCRENITSRPSVDSATSATSSRGDVLISFREKLQEKNGELAELRENVRPETTFLAASLFKF